MDKQELRDLIELVTEEVAAQVFARVSREIGGRLAFSEAEAADLLGIHRNQLAAERREGRISYLQIGKGGVRYSRTQLEKWMQEQERVAPGGQ